MKENSTYILIEKIVYEQPRSQGRLAYCISIVEREAADTLSW